MRAENRLFTVHQRIPASCNLLLQLARSGRPDHPGVPVLGSFVPATPVTIAGGLQMPAKVSSMPVAAHIVSATAGAAAGTNSSGINRDDTTMRPNPPYRSSRVRHLLI